MLDGLVVLECYRSKERNMNQVKTNSKIKQESNQVEMPETNLLFTYIHIYICVGLRAAGGERGGGGCAVL